MTPSDNVFSSDDYPALSRVRKTLRIKWYRCPIAPSRFRQLIERSDLKGFRQAGGHLALWISTAALVYFLWQQQLWAAFIVACIGHGIVSSFFVGVAPHELGHGTVFKTPWLNRFFLYVFSFISWWDPFDYASSHTYHHRYTLHPEGDRENLLPLAPNTSPGFLLQMISLNLLTQKGRTFGKGGLLSTVVSTLLAATARTGSRTIPSNEWLAALHDDQPVEHRKSIWWSRFLLLTHGLIVFLSITTGQWVFLVIVTFAPFIANLPAYAVGMTQHCGLKQNDPDFRKCVRSVVIHPVLEFLYWHMNWHTEHHMFAGVPCYNLKALHAEVRSDMPEPRTLVQAWQEMLDTWRRQQTEPDYFFDTPVPTAAEREDSPVNTLPDDTLKESIGELAPKGLTQQR